MSFQGDVAGIGLGELLQGLARGGRDGVLVLHGEKVSGALGLKGGLLHLLSGPDEDEREWRERSLRAWANDPKPLLETKRREAIARAERLERFYRMLETPNLHFRFEPGPLPPVRGKKPPERSQKGTVSLDEVRAEPAESHGTGTPVEYLLLEHARLADEAGGETLRIEEWDVPRAIDPSRYPREVRDFLEECDGASTVLEIADRLGLPLRLVRARLAEHHREGGVRFSHPRELLAGAQRELEQGRIGRAATRLKGWSRRSAPGPPSVEDAELLVGEWDRDRLRHLLPVLEPRDARTVLRKLDLVHTDAAASLERWRVLAAAHRSAEATQIHWIALRLVATDDPQARSFNDLLRLARALQERGRNARTRTLLRLAARQLPARPQTRIELGRRMIETGLVDEGARWLLDTARELLDRGEGERALVPVRAVLRIAPEHAEAHGLLLEARALLARRRRRLWRSAIVLATVLVLGTAGIVHLQVQKRIDEQLAEVRANLNRPSVALDLLDQWFPDSDSDSVATLRATARALHAEQEDEVRRRWMERFRAIEEECELGDPLLGLRRALEMPPPPALVDQRPFPDRQVLLDRLTTRLAARYAELDLPVDASTDDLHEEERLQTLLAQLLDMLGPAPKESQLFVFRKRLAVMEEQIGERREERAVLRQRALRDRIEKEQDMLLGSARAHAAAGDLERAVATYARLETTADFDELRPLLAEELDSARDHLHAVREATALAERGEHAAAIERLDSSSCSNPGEHLLPWHLDTRPRGARVHMADGSSRVSPFVVKSAPGERVPMRFERDGYEPIERVVKSPADMVVHLNLLPERSLGGGTRVDALPVPVGDDHLVADRKGRLLRLDRDSRPRWAITLDSLGGVARTPLFLPDRPGHVLVLSEDGKAWLVEAATGAAEGPIEIGSPPSEGPVQTARGVWARFTDGRVAAWSDALEPSFRPADEPFLAAGSEPGRENVPSSLVVLRRSASGPRSLQSPWSGWKATIDEGSIRVSSSDGRSVSVRRTGAWTYVAWEAPKALVPLGRLWVSDEGGLRSYRPDAAPAISPQDG